MTELERQTEDNRFNAIVCLNNIINYAEAEISKVRKISLLDDEEHADIVRGYAERTEEIMMDMRDLCMKDVV